MACFNKWDELEQDLIDALRAEEKHLPLHGRALGFDTKETHAGVLSSAPHRPTPAVDTRGWRNLTEQEEIDASVSCSTRHACNEEEAASIALAKRLQCEWDEAMARNLETEHSTLDSVHTSAVEGNDRVEGTATQDRIASTNYENHRSSGAHALTGMFTDVVHWFQGRNQQDDREGWRPTPAQTAQRRPNFTNFQESSQRSMVARAARGELQHHPMEDATAYEADIAANLPIHPMLRTRGIDHGPDPVPRSRAPDVTSAPSLNRTSQHVAQRSSPAVSQLQQPIQSTSRTAQQPAERRPAERQPAERRSTSSHGSRRRAGNLEAYTVVTPFAPPLEQTSGALLECTICMEAFVAGESVCTLPCLHRYHVHCIDRWLQSSKQCPICKHEIGNTQRRRSS